MSLGLASVFLYLNPQIPSTDTYRHYRYETPLQIFTADHLLIGEFGERRLYPIALDDVPRHFLNALVNTEDKRFYDHAGIDLISLANDMVGLVTSPDVRTGASTLTMQLAKIVSFSHKQEFIRKFKEMLLALQVERELDKDEILELYVNIMAFGKHAYGVQAAAYTYYGKPVGELNLAQLAMLAGVIKKRRGRQSHQRRRVGTGAPQSGVAPNVPAWLDQPNGIRAGRGNADYRRSFPTRHRSLGPLSSRVGAARTVRPLWAGHLLRLHRLHHAELETTGNRAAGGSARAGRLRPPARLSRRRGSRRHRRTPQRRGRSCRYRCRLAHVRTVAGLVPAVVVDLDEDRVLAVRRNAELAEIPWAGLRWARPFLGVDSIGARPKTAADVVARRRPDSHSSKHEAEWRLGQLPDIQGALVALDPKNGAVQALVGGWDFHSVQFNHALQARRQPGSGFKPFVYSAALANGLTPASVFWDSPLVFDDANLETVYRPRNDSGEFSNRPMRLREALYRSRNVVSMRMMRHVRAQPIIDHVQRFGFDAGALPRNTQLAIGGGNMAATPIEMARAYAVFANGGRRVEPHVIDRVSGSTVQC